MLHGSRNVNLGAVAASDYSSLRARIAMRHDKTSYATTCNQARTDPKPLRPEGKAPGPGRTTAVSAVRRLSRQQPRRAIGTNRFVLGRVTYCGPGKQRNSILSC